jgi:cell division protein FtsZ
MAVLSPLLDLSREGAKGALLNIAGGSDMALSEIKAWQTSWSTPPSPEANIIFVAPINPARTRSRSPSWS